MNKKIMLMVGLLALPLGTVALGSAPVTAHAKAKTTLKTFPKSIRGTWYTYQYHKMYRYKITSKKIVGTGFTNRLHSRKLSYAVKFPAKIKHPTWVVAQNTSAFKHEHWINVKGWYQSAGDGTYYRRMTRKIGGHKYATLQLASGADAWTDGNAYHSKKNAKKYANHYFKGERR